MTKIKSLLVVLGCFVPGVRAEVITPVDVLGTSEWGIEIFVTSLIDGSGLLDIEETPDDELDDLHDNSPNWTSGWHAGDFDAGIPGGEDDDGDLFTPPFVEDQILEFDLGASFVVQKAHIWQQNQSGLGTFLAPKRGVDEFDILVSDASSGSDFSVVGSYFLDPEEGQEEVPAQIIQFDPVLARRVRLDIKSAHSGEEFEFVGLGEVRFEGAPVAGLVGDFNTNEILDAGDIDTLSAVVRDGTNELRFDLTGDKSVDDADRRAWVVDVKKTYFGDSNLDGEFNSSDFLAVFRAGEYEDGIAGNSTWGSGDWNGDGDFSSSDFLIAFQDGGYELGPRENVLRLVPEPGGDWMAWLVVIGVIARMSCAR